MRLELKVPPDVVALVVAGAMWGVARVTPTLDGFARLRVPVMLLLLVVGVALVVAARVAFAGAATTFSPIAPERARRLVTTGVYRYTRNPMYVGTLAVLLAYAAWLSSPAAALVALVYVAYIDRFQVRPEGRILRERFGDEYVSYARQVRRWL